MGASSATVEGIEERLHRLEEAINRSPVRVGIGGGGGISIRTVHMFPPIPREAAEIIFLRSVDWGVYWTQGGGFLPVDNLLDTYWYATSEDTEWHPIGGKLVDIVGVPGDISGG